MSGSLNTARYAASRNIGLDHNIGPQFVLIKNPLNFVTPPFAILSVLPSFASRHSLDQKKFLFRPFAS